MFDHVDDGTFLYSGLEGKVSNCTECGQCKEKCFKKLLLETYLKRLQNYLKLNPEFFLFRSISISPLLFSPGYYLALIF